MDVLAKVFKRKSGKSQGKWIVRISFDNNVTGRKQTVERHAAKRSEAIDERDRLVTEIKRSHGQIRTGERMTFRQLTEICKERFYCPAVLVEGRKIEGVRSFNTAQNHINVLSEFFGDQLVGQITTSRLKDYRLWRLKIGSRHPAATSNGKKVEIKLATINRELSAMRRMMRFAYSQGWVTKDIFFKAELIDTSAELERTRLLTAAEEKRLLAACQGTRIVTYKRERHQKTESISAVFSVDNPHLKAMILLALDSGMRRGEILKLRWKDLDFENSLIRIVGTHTKTERERMAPLTARVMAELECIREISTTERPFPFTDFKRSWATAKRLAGIDDLRFHDLRRTAVTRWILQGNPIALAGKVAGHSRLETTMKHYTAADAEIVQGFANRMNMLQNETEPPIHEESVD